MASARTSKKPNHCPSGLPTCSAGMQRSNSPRKCTSLSGKKTRCSSSTGSKTLTGSRFLRFKPQLLDQHIIYDPAAFGTIWECSGVKPFPCPENGLMNCRCIDVHVALEVLPTSRRRMHMDPEFHVIFPFRRKPKLWSWQ